MGKWRQEPGPRGEETGFETYDERMNGITRWNIEHTDILEVMRGEIQEEQLISWSRAITYRDKEGHQRNWIRDTEAGI